MADDSTATASASAPAPASPCSAPSRPTDPDFLSCVLQPPTSSSSTSRPDPDYAALRRLLLRRKSSSALNHRMEWRCNGKGYVAYRNFLLRRIEAASSSAHSTPSNSGRWFASPTTFSEADSWSSIRDLRSNSGKLSRTMSVSSKQSEPERHVRFAEPAYSFVGMHCIFDNCKASVTVLQFGRTNSDLLAYGSSDGSLTVCQVSEPPSVLQKLTGHSKDITDFDFSSNNQYIASCSMDKTVRVWEISKGTCIRVVYGVSSQLCICFHPVNNNLLLVGNANREINAINFSTGRVISKLTCDNAVTALDIDHTGQLIFAGDAQGYIYTISVNSHTGSLSRTHKNKSCKSKSSITTIHAEYPCFFLSTSFP
ncbi:WD repeat-containing protein 13 isoform X6 [Triticum urartu]|uniref:WD repeat-containing protein 13 isoform X6 n=1 Tax=Triticum urartu TaxID=4572 RepID=UPI002043325B|nr:WD repeat-containing protein 13 isoform X6 [Triticum urartu]